MRCPNCQHEQLEVLDEKRKKFYCPECRTAIQIVDGVAEVDEESKETLKRYDERIARIEQKLNENGEDDKSGEENQDSDLYFFGRNKK